MTLGPIVVAVGWLLTLGLDLPVDYWWQVLPGMVVVGLGMAMTVAPLTAAILGAVEPARAGIGSAVNNAVARIAGLVAIASIGAIVAGELDVDGYRRAAIATAVLLVVGGAVSWIGIRNPAPPPDGAGQPATSAGASIAADEPRPRS
jgi:hypothetical protein